MTVSPRTCRDCPADLTGQRVHRCPPCRTEHTRQYMAAYHVGVAQMRATECAHRGCTVTGRLTRGLCNTHYTRLHRLGSTADPVYLGPAERRRRKNLRHIERRRENPERVRAYNQAYYAANRRQELARNRAWRMANPDRETARAAGWKARNPIQSRAHWATKNARRYAQIRATRVGPVDYAAILRTFGMLCHLCGHGIASWASLHFDHVIPLAAGGPHVTDNIKPSHARCNQRKGARVNAVAYGPPGGVAT